MKPPWKYLARLVSRQRSPDATAVSSAPDSDRKLVEIEQRPAATVLLSSPELTPASEPMDGAAPENAVAVPAAIEPDAETPDFTEAPKAEVTEVPEQAKLDTQEPGPTVETAVPLPKLRQTRSRTAKTDGGNSTVETPAITDASVRPAASPAGSFIDDAASLDEEIKNLKDLLAQKLRMQNAQLREMLERFERS